MKKQTLSKLNGVVLVAIFCLAIFLPLIIGIVEEDSDTSATEKRQLNTLPELPRTTNDFTRFPALFDGYYSDRFGLRTTLTQYYSWLKFRMGDSPSKEVLIGKNGWLFLGADGPDDPIGDVRNVNLYSENNLRRMSNFLNGMHHWLKKEGIEFLIFVAPNKHTIYFDQLPDYITRVNEQSALDQLYEHLKQHTDVKTVDLRRALIKEKNNSELYYKTGSHWNFMGANIAQYEILKVVEQLFPGKISAELYDKSIFKYMEATDRGLEDLAGIKKFMPAPLAPYPVFEPGAEPVMEHPRKVKIVKNYNSSNKLDAVIFRDSFVRVLEPYFDRKFRKTTYQWSWPNYADFRQLTKDKKPDIVIVEFVERELPAP